MKRKNKVLLCALVAVSFGVAGILGLTSINSSFVQALFNRPTQNTYSLTLGSSNKVSTAGDHTITTAAGGSVVFTYTSVSNNANGHTTIANGGTIVNKSQITSIESLTATFTGGTLKARIAYVVGTWGEYFSLNSGSRVEFGSHPYYLEMKAEGSAVSLTSAVFTYTCQENPAVSPENNSGTYDITFEATGSDQSAALDNSGIFELTTSGYDLVNSFTTNNKVYAGADGLKLGSSKSYGSLTINFDTSEVSNKITAITLSTAKYGTDSGVFELYLNDSYYAEDTTINPSQGGTVVLDNETTLTSLTIETSTKRGYLCGISLAYGGETGPLTPDNPDVYETGFTAEDANYNKYTTNSIFDNDNALVVKSNKSNGTSVAVNPSMFSYVVKDSNDQIIDTSAKFPAVGTYTLVVTYSTYIPQQITLNVGEYIYPVDVTGSMLTTTFNTADVLSEKLAANLTASITYSNSSVESNISYAEFQAHGLGVKLLSKNIVHEIENPFGVPGVWTLRVYHTHDENSVYYDIALTVNAVMVEQITLNESTYELHPTGTLQLVATVGPATATNDDVEWTSSNEDAATVDQTGLVTAVDIGSATITATAADGSGVYGSCVVNVTAAPATTDYTIDTTTDNQVTTNSTSTLVFTNSPAVLTIEKSSSSTNANNYVASGNSPHTRAYKNQKFTISAGSSSISQIVIHGTSDKGTNGFPTTWTNATESRSGYEITLTPTNPDSSVYCTLTDTVSFSGVTVTVGSGSVTPVTPVYPTAITLTGTSSITIGQTSQLTVGYTPGDTIVKNVTFTSSNSNIAGVSNTGLVTGVSQGTATITATAQAASGTVTATLTMTINPVSVTGVSLNETSTSVRVGKTVTLIATVSPSNATNKNVTWSTGSSAIATVTNAGVVTGVGAGTTSITVTTVDGSKTASCSVTVTATGGEEEFSISYTDLPTSYQTGNTVYTAASGIKFKAYQCANYSSKMQFKASAGYLQNTEELELQSITINDRESNSLTVYGGYSSSSISNEITGSNDVYDLTGYNYFKIARTMSGAAYCSSITILTGTPTPTNPTNITLNPTSCEIAPGGYKSIAVTYTPSNANQNKEITWTSSNTNVATVDTSGKVTVKSTATAGQTATITARLTNITPTVSKTCTVTVVEQQLDDHTVLIYMCGADLESGYASSNQGLATGDITEILSVYNQPDDVNIVIETGGASKWSSTYGISSSKLERWHVEDRSLVRDSSLTYASMGLSSTLQSFVEYGLNNYPAERTGLIFWNHGGAMRGVCYDEKKSDDSLLTDEVASAISGALSNCGKSGQKLEWVGYDACLMQVQDIASINSDYFNYMIASEESEAGEGWDYDTWVDDLYAHKTTPEILKACVDGFIKSNGGVNSSSNDQTLSYLNLGYMSAYITAWNNMATQLGTKLTSNNKSSFNTLVKSAKYYADSDYTYYGIFDAKDFINKLANNSTFNPGSTYTSAVLTAFNNLVAYSSCGKGAGNSYGLCMFWSVSSNCAKGTYYTAAMTKFTAWRTLVTTYGN